MLGDNSGGGYIDQNKEKRSYEQMSGNASFTVYRPFCLFNKNLYPYNV